MSSAREGILAVALAMPKEYTTFLAGMEGAEEVRAPGFTACVGHLGAIRLVAYLTGIGKVHAALATREMLLRFGPSHVLNLGVCGALSPILKVGDLVLGSSYAYHDVWCGEGNAFGQIQGLPAQFTAPKEVTERAKANGLTTGLMLTGEYFIPQPGEVERILQHFPTALTVDMESTAIAQTCHLHHVPFAALRIISDTPYLPTANHTAQYENFWKTLASPRFAQARDAMQRLITF